MSNKHTIEERAGMIMACVSMIGIATKGDFMDVLKYIIDNEEKYFIKKDSAK